LDSIAKLSAHPLVTVVIFSGSDRSKLTETFASTPEVWLAAENGVFIRPPESQVSQQDAGGIGGGGWVCSMPTINKDWAEAVQLVFEYFCERTPRSFVEVRPKVVDTHQFIRDLWVLNM
jgi:trehalose 6-phosphate synthase/phosphatase